MGRFCRDCDTELPVETRKQVCPTCRVRIDRAHWRAKHRPAGSRPRRQSVTLGRTGTARERFDVKVRKLDSGCWLWLGSDDGRGYGQFGVDGKLWRAHRWIFIEERGEIPAGLQLDHLCGKRWCVSPAHLEPVTSQENVRRARERRSVA